MKTLFTFVTAFFLILATVTWRVSHHLNPDFIRSELISAFEQNLPGSELRIGDIDITYGSKVRLSLGQIHLAGKASKLNLFSIDQLSLEFNLLGLIIPVGSTDIVINQPKLQWKKKHWNEVLPKNEFGRVVSKVNLPQYFLTSQVNLSIIDPVMIDGNRNIENLNVKQVSLKNISQSSTTAYELRFGDINIKELGVLKSTMVGQFDIHQFLTNGEVEAKGTLVVRVASKYDEHVIKSGFDFQGSFENYQARLDLDANNVIGGQVAIKREKNTLSVKSDKAVIHSRALNAFLNSNAEDTFDTKVDIVFDFKKRSTKGEISGFRTKGSNMQVLGESLVTEKEFQVLSNQTVLLEQGQMLGGSFKINSIIDKGLDSLIETETSLSLKNRVDSTIELNNFKIPENFKVEKDQLDDFIRANSRKDAMPIHYKISGSGVGLNDLPLSFQGAMVLHDSNLKINKLLMTYSNGKLDLQRETKATKLTLQNLNMKALFPLLPKKWSVMDGIVHGKIKIENKDSNLVAFDLNLNKGTWLREPLHQKVWKQYNSGERKIDGNAFISRDFDKMVIEGSYRPSKLNVTKFDYFQTGKYKVNLNSYTDKDQDIYKMKGTLKLTLSQERFEIPFTLKDYDPIEVVLRGDN